MSSLSDFLEFWHEPPAWADPDPVRKIYHTYLGAIADLEDIKSQARDFIIPAKDAKGKLMPVFDVDKLEDVSALADAIDGQKEKIKGILTDVEEIMLLAGSPSTIPLQQEHEHLRHSIQLAETAAGAAMRRAINGRGRLAAPPRPEEIATHPELVEIYAKADVLRAELTPKIEEMAGRLEQIRKIIEKYQD